MDNQDIAWETPTEYVSSIESVIRLSRQQQQYTDPIDWHARATERLQDFAPGEIVYNAQQLLQQAPYDEITRALEVFPTQQDEALVTIRRGRKLFLIARDAIILSTHIHATDDYDILRYTCRELGRLADNQINADITRFGLQMSLSELASSESTSHNFVRSREGMMDKVTSLLDINMHSILHMNFDQNDTEAAHQWRKDFRRIGHVLTLQAASSGDRELISLATQGLSLNRFYGDIVDALDKTT